MVQGLRGRNLKYRMISAGRKIKRVNIISIPCNIRIKFILRTPPFLFCTQDLRKSQLYCHQL